LLHHLTIPEGAPRETSARTFSHRPGGYDVRERP
jgi:hypothetical protein